MGPRPAAMRAASGVVGKVRPGGLLFVDLLNNKKRALLAGTANGVLVTYLDAEAETGRNSDAEVTEEARWTRLGGCDEFPIVLTKGLSHEHYSDTIVAATMGRGIYAMHDAKVKLLEHYKRVSGHNYVPEESSARFFPPQQL